MKIVLATPLYPPDVAEPAPYVKELARRLAASHEVEVVTYGRLPEPVAGVRITAIDKRALLPLRLLRYALALRRATRAADVLYAQNGPSVELPLVLVMLASRRPLVMRLGDAAAHHYAQAHPLRRLIERLAFKRARSVVTEALLPRPEVLPFSPHPREALAAYEQSWERHIAQLLDTFAHA